jgi:sec-independent protein translocase protein TatB
MPSFGDSAFIFILALLLFGPKKLPELARQLGKLMAEFRRASNEFRMQMDEELRLADQAEQQKKIAAMEAAAPVTPSIADTIPEPEHPHTTEPEPYPSEAPALETTAPEPTATEPLSIASSGDLALMPPSTGLPISHSAETPADNSALAPVLETIPRAEPNTSDSSSHSETPVHG